jgi:hypothetical protein
MRLDALIAVQYGVARRDQLLRSGVTPSIIRRRLRSGEWQSVLATVYAMFPGPLDILRREVAGWLYGGPGCQLAGPTAARIHGLRNVPSDPQVHLLVPHHRQLASAGFVVLHRTTRMEERPHLVPPFAVCSLARALADTARWCPDGPAIRALVSEAIERRLTSLPALRAESSSGRRNGSALLRITLDELARDTRHAPEQDLRTALLQSRELPRIVWNPRLVGSDGRGLPWVDGWIDEVGIGVEVDLSTEASPDEWERTARRHALLEQYGVLVLQFPAARISRDPFGVRAAVERAYRHRRACRARARAVLAAPGRLGTVAQVGQAALDEGDVVECHRAAVAGRRLRHEPDLRGLRAEVEVAHEGPGDPIGGGVEGVRPAAAGHPHPDGAARDGEPVRVVRGAPGDH